MKTPKKVIEKISLPLMFVTFVMAALMFAVSPVSAAPDLCDELFCDQDNDGFFRDHKKCPNGCEDINTNFPVLDCDDNDEFVPAPNDCPGVVSEGSITYTAQLTAGAFVFNPGPVVTVFPNSRDNVLWSETNLNMDIVDGSSSNPLDTTWDTVFNTCVVLVYPDSVNNFTVPDDDWFISKAGGVRVMFRDFLVPYRDGSALGAEVTVQLIGNEFAFDADSTQFPPVPEADPGDTAESVFYLDRFVIWGTTAKGEPGPRRACQLPGDGGGGGDMGDLSPSGSTLKITATRGPST